MYFSSFLVRFTIVFQNCRYVNNQTVLQKKVSTRDKKTTNIGLPNPINLKLVVLVKASLKFVSNVED